MAKIGLVDPGRVIDGCVVRQPKAYPVYDDEYRENVDDDPRASWSDVIRTLHLVGRNGMHKYNNQDHAMMTAMLTVAEHPGGPDAPTTSGRSMRMPNIMKRGMRAPTPRSLRSASFPSG